MTPSASRESSVGSCVRRASSVQDMESLGSRAKMAFRDRHASEGKGVGGGGGGGGEWGGGGYITNC